MEHNLESQPVNILNIITEYLKARDVISLASTCRRLWFQRDKITIHDHVRYIDHSSFIRKKLIISPLTLSENSMNKMKLVTMDYVQITFDKCLNGISDKAMADLSKEAPEVTHIRLCFLFLDVFNHPFDTFENLTHIYLREVFINNNCPFPDRLKSLSIVDSKFPDGILLTLPTKLEKIMLFKSAETYPRPHMGIVRDPSLKLIISKPLKYLIIAGLVVKMVSLQALSDHSTHRYVLNKDTGLLFSELTNLIEFTYIPEINTSSYAPVASRHSLLHEFIINPHTNLINLTTVVIYNSLVDYAPVNFKELRIRELVISRSKLDSLTLPDGYLKKFKLINSSIREEINLPESLQTLLVASNIGKSLKMMFKNFPTTLKHLEIVNVNNIVFSEPLELPENLETLKLLGTHSSHPLELPPKLKYLDLTGSVVGIIDIKSGMRLSQVKVNKEFLKHNDLIDLEAVSDSFIVVEDVDVRWKHDSSIEIKRLRGPEFRY
jgi:hypothetical protein